MISLARRLSLSSILLITIIVLISAGGVVAQGANDADDSNGDGLSEAVITEQASLKTVLSNSSGLTIGMIETAHHFHAMGRLTGLGYSVTLIPPTSGLATFQQYDIVYLPSDWAEVGLGDLASIEERAADYQDYVQSGGGLFIDQPNPFGQPGEQVTPTLLPYPITFYNPYDTSDWPPIIVNAAHEITQGLSESEMPFPADQMLNIDPHYELLVKGRQTGSGSLVVSPYGNGRILIQTAHPSPQAIFPFSDQVYMRMVEWVGGVGTGDPIPGAVLNAESQFFQTTQNSIKTIDDTYTTMVVDTAADLTLSVFKIAASKAADKLGKIDADTPLRERGLVQSMRKLGVDLGFAVTDNAISTIISDNLTLQGIVFPVRADNAHQGFITQRVTLSPSADLNLIVSDINDKRLRVSRSPNDILRYKKDVFDRVEQAEAVGDAVGTYVIVGGAALIVKGVIFTPTAAINIPLGLKALAVSSLFTKAEAVTNIGEMLALIYKFGDVLEDEIQIITLYERELQRVTASLESGQLVGASGQLTQVSGPGQVRLDKSAKFQVTFQNTGLIDVDARLRTAITDPNGETREPYTSDTQTVPASGQTHLSVDVPFPGFLGIFGTTGDHTFAHSAEYGFLALEEETPKSTGTFLVVRRGASLFKFVTFGSPVTVGILVQNNDSEPVDFRVIDEIPKQLASSVSEIQFITPPDNVIEDDPKVEWAFTLEPSQSMTLLYRIPSPGVDLSEDFIVPPATLVSTGGTELTPVILMESEDANRFSVGSIQVIRQAVQALPDEAFRDNGSPDKLRRALLNKTDEVILKVEEGSFEEAINKLQNDIRPKLDGDPSPEDWIVSRTSQEELLQLIDPSSAMIMALAATPAEEGQ